MNLFATIEDMLSSEVLAQIASYIDEPAEKTSKAVDGLVFTIVGGLMKRTTSEIGVNQLYNRIQKNRYDGSLTDSLTTVLRDPALTNTLITQGNDVISHLLPAMKSSIGTMISGYAGIRNSSVISLLGLVTAIVLHALGRQVKERKLDADGLAAALFAERETLVNTVPDEFMPQLVEKMGLQQIVAGLAAPARRTSVESPGSVSRPVETVSRPAMRYDPADDADPDNGSVAKWAVGALLVVAIGIGGYFIYHNTQKYSSGQDEVSSQTPIEQDTTQADTVTRSLAVPKDSTLRTPPKPVPTTPTALTPAVAPTAAGNLTGQLTPYLGNPALPKGRVFPLTGVSFQPGSLSMTAGSQATVGELATLLKTYPRLQVQLVGYANDAGGSLTNKSLSFKRVNQIKQQLVDSGIDFIRIDAIGRGTGVAKNDTLGPPKPALRKIDLKVVVK